MMLKNYKFFYFFLFFLFFNNNLILTRNFSSLENSLYKQISFYLEKAFLEPNFDHLWIEKVLQNKLTIQPIIFKYLLDDQKLYKKFKNELTLKGLQKFSIIKKNILSQLSSEKLQNDAKVLLDILYFVLSKPCDVMRYPQYEIIEQVIQKLESILSAEVMFPIRSLIESLAFGCRELRKPIEILNQIQAITYIQNLNLKTRSDIKIEHIITFHKILLNFLLDSEPGTWRTGPCKHVKIDSGKYPDALEIPRLMDEFVAWLNNSQEHNILKLAAMAHIKLQKLHPFIDGNNRVGLMLLNLLLIQENYSPLVMFGGHKSYMNYYDIVDKTVEADNFNIFYEFLLNELETAKFEGLNLKNSKKIGIYIGTFDPFHMGHDNLIKEIFSQGDLDYIIVIPNTENKSKPFKSDLSHRKKIIQDVYSEEKQIITTFWKSRDVVNHIKQINPYIEIIGIVGSDVAENYSYQDRFLFDADAWIVGIRDKKNAINKKLFLGQPTTYIDHNSHNSTDIRAKLKQKNVSWQDLPLHQKAIEYIKNTNLYKATVD